jgi:hypothetical protein
MGPTLPADVGRRIARARGIEPRNYSDVCPPCLVEDVSALIWISSPSDAAGGLVAVDFAVYLAGPEQQWVNHYGVRYLLEMTRAGARVARIERVFGS